MCSTTQIKEQKNKNETNEMNTTMEITHTIQENKEIPPQEQQQEQEQKQQQQLPLQTQDQVPEQPSQPITEKEDSIQQPQPQQPQQQPQQPPQPTSSNITDKVDNGQHCVVSMASLNCGHFLCASFSHSTLSDSDGGVDPSSCAALVLSSKALTSMNVTFCPLCEKEVEYEICFFFLSFFLFFFSDDF